MPVGAHANTAATSGAPGSSWVTCPGDRCSVRARWHTCARAGSRGGGGGSPPSAVTEGPEGQGADARRAGTRCHRPQAGVRVRRAGARLARTPWDSGVCGGSGATRSGNSRADCCGRQPGHCACPPLCPSATSLRGSFWDPDGPRACTLSPHHLPLLARSHY